VHKTYDTFLQCTICERVYWTGTHVQRMGLAETKKSKRPSS
jgi:uncharacterized protein with PIN domain